MKAQISFVEYLFAFTIFITFVAYIFFRMINFIPTYLEEIKNEILRSEAYQISEILVNDPGEPLNWNIRNVKRIGLSNHLINKTNFLSVEKMANLKSICDGGDYTKIKNSLGVTEEYDFEIFLSDSLKKFFQDQIICQPSEKIKRKTLATVKRFVAFTNGIDVSYGELIVQVW